MKKRILSLLVTLCLLLGLMPTAAFAEEPEEAPIIVTVCGLSLNGDGYYKYTVDADGIPISEGTAEDYNVRLNGTTLTLNNATLASDYGDVVTMEDEENEGTSFTLELIGQNTITVNDSTNSAGIGCYNSTLTITGDGSLTIEGSGFEYGLWTSGGLTIGGGDVRVSGPQYGVYSFIGGSKVVVNGGSLTIQSETQAICSWNNSGTLKVTADGYTVFEGEDADSATDSSTDYTRENGATVSSKYLRVEKVEAHSHDGVTFQPWSDATKLPTTAGNYYLTTDVTLSRRWEVNSGNPSICLNGHVIQPASGPAMGVIYVAGEHTTLNLYDCNTTAQHKFSVDDTGLWTLDEENGAKIVTGGVITGGRQLYDGNGGGVYLTNEGTLNLYGGTICGNSADGDGGGVCLGGWYTNVHMYGGAICGNTAGGSGGGIWVRNSGSEFTVSGRAVIAENTVAGQPSNIYLAKQGGNNAIITIGEDVLTEGARFGVTSYTAPTENSPVAITKTNDKDYSGYFFSENSSYTIQNSRTNVVQLVVKPHTHTLTKTEAKDATCTAEGNIEYWTCSSCNKMFSDAAGTAEVNDVAIAMLAHDFTGAYLHDADGHWHKCANCVATDTKTAHIWNEGETTKQPTCTEPGETTYACTVCGQTKTETVSALDHQWQAATCTVPETCSVCHTTKGAALGHDYAYTASGGVITGTCQNDNSHTHTATLTAQDAAYDGTAKATGNVAYSEGWPDKTLAVTYANHTNAGTATASITYGGATASVDFAIAKADYSGNAQTHYTANVAADGVTGAQVTLDALPDGGTFGTPTVSGNSVFVTSPIVTNGVLTFNSIAVTHGAVNTITVPVIGCTNYKDFTMTVEVTAVNVEVVITGITVADKTYDGQSVVPDVSQVKVVHKNDPSEDVTEHFNAANVTYTYYKGSVAAENKLTTPPSNAGVYWLTVTLSDSEHFGSQAPFSFTIAKATPAEGSYTVPSGLAATEGQTLGDIALPSGWAWADSAQTVGSAGTNTFSAVYTTADRDNYESVTVNVTIAVSAVTPPTPPTPPEPGEAKGEVEVKPGTPAVSVDTETLKGLAGEVTEGQTVIVTLSVEKLEAPADKADFDVVVTDKADDVLYLDFSLLRQVDGGQSEAITDTGDAVLEIAVPYDFIGKKDVTVYRKHGDTSATALTKLAEKPTQDYTDGSFFADSAGGTVYIYASKFSTYAIGYTEVTTEPEPTPTTKPVSSVRRPNGRDKQEPEVVETVCAKDDTCPIAAFTDAKASEWYHDGVHYCLENGLMVGTSSTSFAPSTTASRATIVTILWRQAGSPTPAKASTFDDVAAGAWYAQAVAWCAENGVVDGYGNGKFGPDDTITRGQLAAMLWRYAGKPATEGSLGSFTDSAEVGTWAVDALRWAVEQGIVTGKSGGVLDPLATPSRAEAATMLWRFLVGTEE